MKLAIVTAAFLALTVQTNTAQAQTTEVVRSYAPGTTISTDSNSEQCLYGRNTVMGGCNQPPRTTYSYSYEYRWSAPRPTCNPLSPRCNY